MLEKSDNTAEFSLYRILKLDGINDPFSSIYSYIGWEGYTDMGTLPSYIDINLKTLSNMFVSLYNADYLNPDDSAKILQHLDNSIFNSQIVAGVPENISVAHKIGVMIQDKTYSDCGIVYVPNRNYILCLGSTGADQEIANKFMKEISAATYEFVSSN
jgi:beta-lactamase class A